MNVFGVPRLPGIKTKTHGKVSMQCQKQSIRTPVFGGIHHEFGPLLRKVTKPPSSTLLFFAIPMAKNFIYPNPHNGL
jgi:hypothetical protein